LPPPDPSVTSVLENAYRSYQQGAIDDAIDTLFRLSPEKWSQDCSLLHGACLARSKRGDEAVAVFTEVLELDPKCHEAMTWMAVLTKEPDNMDRALGYARRAVEIRPDDATSYGALGTCYLAAHLPSPAIESLERAVALAPNAAEHRHNLALAHLKVYHHAEAISQLREAILLAPRNPQSYLVLATTYGLFGMAGEAIECLTKGLAQMPECAPLHSALAAAYATIRNDEKAELHHRRAVKISPESRGGFGTWLLNQGRFEEANDLFGAMVREKADPAYGYYGLMLSKKLKDRDEDNAFVAEMESLLATALRPRSEMYLRYALGRAEEQRKRYEEAMSHFDVANRIAFAMHRAGQPNDPAQFAEEHAQIRRVYEANGHLAKEGDPTQAPIFIIGMIRSGTTLLDQIVSSHREVASGGELRFWVEEGRRLVLQSNPLTSENLNRLAAEYVEYSRLLAGQSERITDKMPLNFTYAGLMNLAMPNARFLHIRRNPIDTCLSIWTTYFSQGAIFAYDKANIVAYYREYERLMDYWREVLPKDRLFEVEYEDLTSNPESVIPKIVEFLGLPWDDACLHHDQNTSAINTPSRWQARQPIYKTSVERWRNYEPWLGAFGELL
jgi:tetratricopeptide (TPR) repeat protein